MKTIDVETAEGLAEFQRLAALSSARSRSRGKKTRSDQSLLRSLAFNLSLPVTDSEDGEFYHYSRNLEESKLLEKYARAQEQHAWKTDGTVWSVLQRRAADGNGHARELVNRINGKRGEYEESAAPEYYRLKAAAYRAAGNNDAARECEKIAMHPNAARELLTSEPGKRIDPRVERAQRRLTEYEKETAGVAPKSDEEFDIASRLAAAEGVSLHDYRALLGKARKARAKRNALI